MPMNNIRNEIIKIIAIMVIGIVIIIGVMEVNQPKYVGEELPDQDSVLYPIVVDINELNEGIDNMGYSLIEGLICQMYGIMVLISYLLLDRVKNNRKGSGTDGEQHNE